MLPHAYAGSHASHSTTLASQRRALRAALLFLVLTPLLIYCLHSAFGAYTSLHRAHCDQEVSAIHTHYKERIARVLGELQRAVSKETALLHTSSRQERELLNAQLAQHAAESTMKDLHAQVADLQAQLEAATAATARKAREHEEALAQGGRPAEQADDASATPSATVEVLPRSGNVEVRPIDQLLALNAEQKAAAAAADSELESQDPDAPSSESLSISDTTQAEEGELEGGDDEAALPAGAASSVSPAGAGSVAAPASVAASLIPASVATDPSTDPEIRAAEAQIEKLDAAVAEAQEHDHTLDGTLDGAGVKGEDPVAGGAKPPKDEEGSLPGTVPSVSPSAGAASPSNSAAASSPGLAPALRVVHHQIVKASAPIGTPVVVLVRSTAANAAWSLRQTLASLLQFQPPTGWPLFVSVEEDPAAAVAGAAGAGAEDQDTMRAPPGDGGALNQVLFEHKGKVHVLRFDASKQSMLPDATSATTTSAGTTNDPDSTAALSAPIARSSALHLRFLFGELFDYLSYSSALFLSAGQVVSPDFFAYFTAMEPLLLLPRAEDEAGPAATSSNSLLCVSAWNARGVRRLVGTPSALARNGALQRQVYRTDVWPGSDETSGDVEEEALGGGASASQSQSLSSSPPLLGFLLRKELWVEEWRDEWPASRWDEWVRSGPVHQGRDCLYPEIPRVTPPQTTQSAPPSPYLLQSEKLVWDTLTPAVMGGPGGADVSVSSSDATATAASAAGGGGSLDYLLGPNYPAYLTRLFGAPSTRRVDQADLFPSEAELRAWGANRTAQLRELQAKADSMAAASGASESTPNDAAGEGGAASPGSVALAELEASIASLRRDQEVLLRYSSPATLRSWVTALGAGASLRRAGPPHASWRGIVSVRRHGHRVWMAPQGEFDPKAWEQDESAAGEGEGEGEAAKQTSTESLVEKLRAVRSSP